MIKDKASPTLWLFYDDHVQKVALRGRPSVIGAGKHAETRIDDLETELEAHQHKDGRCVLTFEQKWCRLLQPDRKCEIEVGTKTMTFLFTNEQPTLKKYFLGGDRTVSISNDAQADVVLPETAQTSCMLLRKNDQWVFHPTLGDQIYLNGTKVVAPTPLETGDVLLIGRLSFSIIEDDVLTITSTEPYETSLSQMALPTSLMQEKYPMYRRTPRIIYREPDDEVGFSMPSEEQDDHQRPLWMILLPPLFIILFMGAFAFFIPRGWFMLMIIPMMLATAIVGVAWFFREKRIRREKEEKRQRRYTEYLEEKRDELQKLLEEQKHALTYHLPTFKQMKYQTARVSHRVWEKTMEHEDFLEVRVGRSSVPVSFTLSNPGDEMSERDRDALLEDSEKLRKAYNELKDAPLRLSVKSGAYGFVGKPETVQQEVAQMIGQLAFFHSYHDVRFVAVLDEERRREWDWMSWLPHFTLPSTHAKGFIYNEKASEQLLKPLYQAIRERHLSRQEDRNKNKKIRFSPHLIFFIENRALISEHAIMEYLEGKDQELGFSVIFLSDVAENLSEHVHTIVKVINKNEGEIVIREGEAEHKRFRFDEHEEVTNEPFARMLASLNHQRGMIRSIPDMVSFMELFEGAARVEDLAIQTRWERNDSSKSLATPVGFKAKGEIIELNAHEKAHGPHGLLAGTTGSGKSEFLQTYILSLAVNYHPHEVAFLLIDYKGGGMAQPFENMPHLLGVITNIEDSENFSLRALASIKSELHKRQRLFDQHKVNHIHNYMNLYNKGEATEPMPHLFIISDEFAELKAEEPDFIKELISAARIGRSLGVHLLLATQKPSGVVDDQIWSNSRFKVALKVQDASDSREVLKNDDAADIKETGRGYLQVGNNEQYDLFQSGWSGAEYLRATHQGEEDVSYVTDLGLVLVSSVNTDEAGEKNVTEIEAVVTEIASVTEAMQITPAKSPWLEPLEERMSRPVVSEGEKKFPLGLVDDPEYQRQFPIYYEWGKSGNVMIYGAGGFGKSMTLMTLLMSMADATSPEQAHYYILDFGNGALLPLRQLAHTGDYIKVDEARKIEKLMDLMRSEIDRRNELFLEKEVSNIAMYNEMSDESLPSIFLVIDNFDIILEEFEDYIAPLIQFARDGQSRGVYLFATASGSTAIRAAILNNMQTKICHYMLDDTDLTNFVGKPPFVVEQIPGRMIVRKEKNWFAQAYLPAEGKNDYEVLENVKEHIQALNKKYDGLTLPEEIAMLPTRLTLVDFQKRVPTKEANRIPIGLNEDTVKPVYVSQNAGAHLLVVGEPQRGKSNVLKLLLTSYVETDVEKIVLFDGYDRPLACFSGHEKTEYISTSDQLERTIEELESLLKTRADSYQQALDRGEQMPSFRPFLFAVDHFVLFQEMLQEKAYLDLEGKFLTMMKTAGHLGFHLIAAANNKEIAYGGSALVSELKEVRQHIFVMRLADQDMVTTAFRSSEKLEPTFGYHMINGTATKIKIPEVLKEEEPMYV
ncbi:type VII secretion protein EssC [Shouchella lonarensis]|uniref:Type VII secretion system protein EssC n=1 Tax=Shouchella lonarensis TaxID=1464122 RepID=A0A1G6HQK7_9BACI|nr:type VII secretion protein EssC [Shouchella lonarensis]SDB95766.1 DNA segregation ATPase FtsK/SpoIIIE, S-DNA-T family [Shouchella lonarensis]